MPDVFESIPTYVSESGAATRLGGGGGIDQNTADLRYFKQGSNLAEGDPSSIRANIDVYSKSEANSRYLQVANNLSELTNITGVKTFDSDLTIGSSTTGADLHVYGNIFQEGEIYKTVVEELRTKKDFIISREGALGGLAAGALSGLKVLKADGIQNVLFGTDNSAIARVGWEGDTLQAIATREDAPTLNGIPYFDSEDKFATSSNATLDALGNLTATTLNTGQGANELYPMNQGVRTTDDVVHKSISASSYIPIEYEIDNTVNYYHLGTLIRTGARVKFIITGNNGYGTAKTNVTYATVSIGNSIGEVGGWQYTIGDSPEGQPDIAFIDNGDTTAEVYLVNAGQYFHGSLEVVESNNYTPSGNEKVPITDPSATITNKEYRTRTVSYFNENVNLLDTLTGVDASFSSALSANTLRPDSGKFLSPVSYQFRNAGDTDFRDVQMAGLQATTGAFSGAISGADNLTIDKISRLKGASYFYGDVQSDNAVSRVSGWQGNRDGDFDFRSIFADSLTVKAFTADVAQAFRGSTFLTKSFATIDQSFTVPAVSSSATLTVRDIEGYTGLEVFEQNDFILLNIVNQSNGGLTVGEAWGEITSTITDNGDGTQSFTFTTRSVSTASIAGMQANEGSEALSFGGAADPKGFIHSTVLDNLGSPYSQTVTWTANPWDRSNWTVQTRTGNLAGIANASGFGFYGENTFLTGSLLVGDLTEVGSHLKYASSKLSAKLDELDITIDLENYIKAGSAGIDLRANAFFLDAGNLLIDSTYGIDVNVHEILNDGTFDFANGAIYGTATSAGINVDDFTLNAGTGDLIIESATPKISVSDFFEVNASAKTARLGTGNNSINYDVTNGIVLGSDVTIGYQQVEGLEVGGRNYFTRDTSISDDFQGDTTTTKDDSIHGFQVVAGTTTDAEGNGIRINNVIWGNGYWTLSFWAKASAPYSIQVDICDGGVTSFDVNTSYQKFTLTHNVRNYGDGSTYDFIDIVKIADNNTITFKDVKVEQGTIATDWTPAPEDISYQNNKPDYITSTKITQTTIETPNLVAATGTLGVLTATDQITLGTGGSFVSDNVIFDKTDFTVDYPNLYIDAELADLRLGNELSPVFEADGVANTVSMAGGVLTADSDSVGLAGFTATDNLLSNADDSTQLGILDKYSNVFGDLTGRDGVYTQNLFADGNAQVAGSLSSGLNFYAGDLTKNGFNTRWDSHSDAPTIQETASYSSNIAASQNTATIAIADGAAEIYATLAYPDTSFVQGEWYILSAWVSGDVAGVAFRAEVNNDPTHGYALPDEETGYYTDRDSVGNFYAPDENMKRITYGFRWTKDITVDEGSLWMYLKGADGQSVTIEKFQIEEGTHPTIYQPASGAPQFPVDTEGAWMNRGGFGGTPKNPAWKVNDESIRSEGAGESMIDMVGGASPYFHLRANNGEELMVGGDFSFDAGNDKNLARADFAPDIPSSWLASAQVTSSTTSDNDSKIQASSYPVAAEDIGKIIRVTAGYDIDLSASKSIEGFDSIARAETTLTLRFLNAGVIIASKSASREKQVTNGFYNDAGDLLLSDQIPEGTTDIEVVYHSSASANKTNTNSSATPSASGELTFTATLATIQATKEFFSPLGLALFNEGSASAVAEQVRLDRATGMVLGSRIDVQSVHGDVKWHFSVGSGGALNLYKNGTIVDTWA